jgi:polysaccharide export outer membrane protein
MSHPALRVIAACVLGASVTVATQACRSVPGTVPRGHSQTFTREGEYRVGEGDILEIQGSVSKEPPMVVTVGLDGAIVLPLVGGVQARGLTLAEIARVVNKKQETYVRNPNFSVAMREMRSYLVTVVGEVKNSGEFTLVGRTTLLGALARGGGLTDYADERFTLLRRAESGPLRFDFSLEDLVRAEASGEPVYVERADILLVH